MAILDASERGPTPESGEAAIMVLREIVRHLHRKKIITDGDLDKMQRSARVHANSIEFPQARANAKMAADLLLLLADYVYEDDPLGPIG